MRRTSGLRAWLVFLGILLLGHVTVEAAGTSYEARVNALTARSLGWALSVFGAHGETVGDTVTGRGSSGEFSIRIIRECTAESSVILLVAAILAYPCTWRDRAIGLALGVPCVLLLNLVRLTSLFWVGLVRRELFETAHLVVWQSLMVLAVVGLWLLWTQKWVGRDARRTA